MKYDISYVGAVFVKSQNFLQELWTDYCGSEDRLHKAWMVKHTLLEEDTMYYVIQVAPGMEEKTEMLIRKRVNNGLYECCFHPIRHVRKKFHGEWKDQYEKLLPGYVFIISNFIQELYLELQKMPLLTKILGKDGEQFVALSDEERGWLEHLMGTNAEKSNGVGLSQVAAEQGAIVILSGPLKNMEGYIKKINLHKRIAEVEIEFMNRKTMLHLGIEIIGKKEQK